MWRKWKMNLRKLLTGFFIGAVLALGVYGLIRYKCENNLKRIAAEAKRCGDMACILPLLVEYAEARNGYCVVFLKTDYL